MERRHDLAATLAAALAAARERGAAWAPILEGGTRHEVARLDAAASNVARELARAGCGAGTRIGFRVANTVAHVAGLFGIWRAGASAIPLDPRLTEGEAEGLVRHAGAAAWLEIDEDGSARVRRRDASVGSAAPLPEGEGEDAEAVVAYTSGTTGRPKGVLLTHAHLLRAAEAVVQTRRDGPASVAAVVSPLCHVPIFVSHYLARLVSGGTVLLLGSFDPEQIPRLIREHGVTDLPLVPAMTGPLLESRDQGGLASLTKVTVGSAMTPMSVKQALAERFPAAEILEAYGQTESADGLTMTVGREALEHPGTVGRPHAPFRLAIRAPDGTFLPRGRQGEIVVRGPTVMRGYLGDPEATAAALRDGWLHTGDLGRLDGDGRLYVTGRLKEIIITGGENVSPEEVEAVLARHPAVIEAVVFGTPHERWGEQVTVAVIARAEVTVEELREFARLHLAGFKLPRALVRVDSFPRTSAGKVRRAALRDLLDRTA
ncbi:MAG: long-chain fatty acid--CoA ligase [Deltaproteobacteria bacterium]|nr:long-chain fatty acid--CoA ligase [Deltaproteobacteria bacterium]